MPSNLNELRDEIHQNAVEHGWWDEERGIGEIIALCHSELSEALEEARIGAPAIYCQEYDIDYCGNCVSQHDLCPSNGNKPEGVAVELADCIIRILDYCGRKGIDIDAIVRLKHEYNKRRPYKHGKEF
jgi:hypothetical protein